MEHDARRVAGEGSEASGTDGDRLCIGLTNLPDEETALRVARSLVEEGLAACVNVQAPCRSIYRWQGKVEDATEWPLLVKTTAARWNALVERLRALGRTVEYMVFEDEGHGFTKVANSQKAYKAAGAWFERHLLGVGA